MFYTLDRTEDGNIAVMISDANEKIDVPFSLINGEIKEGNVYTCEDGSYIYNEKKTANRRNSNREKLNRLMKRAKNRQ